MRNIFLIFLLSAFLSFTALADDHASHDVQLDNLRKEYQEKKQAILKERRSEVDRRSEGRAEAKKRRRESRGSRRGNGTDDQDGSNSSKEYRKNRRFDRKSSYKEGGSQNKRQFRKKDNSNKTEMSKFRYKKNQGRGDVTPKPTLK
tara:strand:+ start:271 stop:708 length:438 start_codon:yes stop_codon:yes gene_type:complete